MNELEDAFSMDQDREKSRATQTSKRQSVTTVLDITRANNVGGWKTSVTVLPSGVMLALQLLCCPALNLVSPRSASLFLE